MLLKSVKIYCVQTHFYTQTVHRNTPAGHDCYWVQRVKGLYYKDAVKHKELN